MDTVDADEITVLEGAEDTRKWKIRDSEGRTYYAKGLLCPKRRGENNATWLANEIVYARFATRANLRQPKLSLWKRGSEVRAICSEYEDGRECLCSEEQLSYLCKKACNKKQLVRALLLDLALLNSDRTVNNILSDASDRLFFIDHDKSLWGDGKEQSQSGDLGRIDTSIISSKFEDYVRDYLQCREANVLVWQRNTETCIREEFANLQLSTQVLQESLADVPNGWVDQSKCQRMESFLGKWWAVLNDFWLRPQSIDRTVSILTRRERV